MLYAVLQAVHYDKTAECSAKSGRTPFLPGMVCTNSSRNHSLTALPSGIRSWLR